MKAGHVKYCDIATDRETGRSRGFAFLVMEDERGVNNAIEMFDGSDLDGRAIAVKEAEARG
jgi:RNA recognition motif-containing protein